MILCVSGVCTPRDFSLRLEILGQQFVDAASRVASCDSLQGYLEAGKGFEIIDFGGRDAAPNLDVTEI